MGTRGAIARRTAEGTFAGRYHHWDSYPDGLGKTLWHRLKDTFDDDLSAMLEFLIDEHPAGWSTINGKDLTVEPGWGGEQAECFCHGERSEGEWTVTQEDAASSGVEWVYAFDEDARTMLVLASYTPEGHKMIDAFGMGDSDATWSVLAEFDLDGPEPDWEDLTQAGEELPAVEDPERLEAAYAQGDVLRALVDARTDLERARDHASEIPESYEGARSYWVNKIENILQEINDDLKEKGVGAPVL
jgi:hypothetical protein